MTQPDFYFTLQKFCIETDKEKLEEISDSETVIRQTQDEIDNIQKTKTLRSISSLHKQVDAMNDALHKVEKKLRETTDKTIKYVESINDGKNQVAIPRVEPL